MANDVKAQMMHQLAIENATVIARQNAELDTLRTSVDRMRLALYNIEQEALSYNHYGYAKMARNGLTEEK